MTYLDMKRKAFLEWYLIETKTKLSTYYMSKKEKDRYIIKN